MLATRKKAGQVMLIFLHCSPNTTMRKNIFLMTGLTVVRMTVFLLFKKDIDLKSSFEWSKMVRMFNSSC